MKQSEVLLGIACWGKHWKLVKHFWNQLGNGWEHARNLISIFYTLGTTNISIRFMPIYIFYQFWPTWEVIWQIINQKLEYVQNLRNLFTISQNFHKLSCQIFWKSKNLIISIHIFKTMPLSTLSTSCHLYSSTMKHTKIKMFHQKPWPLIISTACLQPHIKYKKQKASYLF
jgi:hypothetical protein